MTQTSQPPAEAAPPLDITVVILTHNESRHIERAIATVRGVASQVLVVDSLSTDDTVHLATACGARVITNQFENYSRQFQWALDNGSIDSEWVMRLDADEVIEPDLAAEIRSTLPSLGQETVGINFDRKHIFMGRWIRHGGRYPLRLLRLWRTKQGRIEDRWMDEHIVVWGGGVVTLKGGFADSNLGDLTFFTDKHNKYATREAVDILNTRYKMFNQDRALSTQSSSGQAKARRTLKETVYNRMPFWLGPTAYFLFRYVIQLGFLDGREGLIYHFLQGFWYRFLVNAKVVELNRELASCADNACRLQCLARLTGLRLVPSEAALHARQTSP